LQEFTIIKEDAQLGRLQLYMKGKKLSSTGTLFSEGKGSAPVLSLLGCTDLFIFFVIFWKG